MRWFNWLGLGMLVSDIGLLDLVLLSNWYESNIILMIAIGAYTLVAISLLLWNGPSEDEPRKRPT
jgi:hypothetical protein